MMWLNPGLWGWRTGIIGSYEQTGPTGPGYGLDEGRGVNLR